MSTLNSLDNVTHFIWDRYNYKKSWVKHQVAVEECEEVFEDPRVALFPDRIHSTTEERWVVFGTTKNKRQLSIAFTVRENGIRVISARPMSRKERRIYEKI